MPPKKVAQFELFAPINCHSDVKVNNEDEVGIQAIVRSVATQRFIIVKDGINPIAIEKDPSLATVFVFEPMQRYEP